MASKVNLNNDESIYRNKVKEISRKCRNCLLNNGKSPDFHIYELDSSFFDYDKNSAKEYLRKVRNYYDSLGHLERMILINDCLEEGRHYRFWYLSFFYTRDYKKKLSSICQKLAKAF